jgi:hypothetical protein
MRGCLSFGASLLLLVGCPGDSDDKAQVVTCVDGDARCGQPCSEASPCAAGLYCTGGGMCAKQCAPAQDDCPGASQCMANGKCLEPSASNNAGSGGTWSGPTSGVGGQVFAGRSGGGGSGSACAQTSVTTARVVPTVILVVDRSASMAETFGDGTRWDALKSSLLAQNGLIKELQSQVNFGLTFYSAYSDEVDDVVSPIGECPRMDPIAPARANFDEIVAHWGDKTWQDDTPTGEAIDSVVASLGLDPGEPIPETEPIIFILATDGEPDSCAQLDPNEEEAQMKSIAAVTRAFEKGIRTYVISVGNDLTAEHQIAVAKAGQGLGPSDTIEPFRPQNDQMLRDTLRNIVGAEISCDITLDGSVEGGDPCLGQVELNGNALLCNDENGWELMDATHIRLMGSACEQLKSDASATLAVSFPCEVRIDFPQ